MTVVPVILCGGSGTRLWPLSRKKYPKQFSKLLGEKSLIQLTAERFNNDFYDTPYVVANENYRFIVQEHLDDNRLTAEHLIIEPQGKNTAPAILAAALQAQKENPQTILLITPSDHYYENPDEFQKAVQTAYSTAQKGEIITFGIEPTRPETGYGYIKVPTECIREDKAPIRIESFVEKPDLASVQHMQNDTSYFWNSGVFMFSVETIIETFRSQYPNLVEHTQTALNEAQIDEGFIRLAAEPWNKIEADSIDYAILEKVEHISMQPILNAGWSDLGEWDSIWHKFQKNKDGTALKGQAIEVNCTNSLFFNEDKNKTLVGLGLDNIIAVSTTDAILVIDKDKTGDVGKVVELLRKNDIHQGENFNREYRPWGYYEILAQGEGFQTKRIVLKPGGILSLQSHQQRSEHWVVVSGIARVTIDGTITDIKKNQSTYIPNRIKHRLENPSDEITILIEVQIGSYLGEDDIMRFDDIYNRNNKSE